MIKKMARVQFIGMRSTLPETLEFLQGLGIVELEDTAMQHELGLTPFVLGEAEEKQKAELELALVSVDGLLERFQSITKKKETYHAAKKFKDMDEAKAKLTEIKEEVQNLLSTKSAKRDELTLLSHYREVIKSLSSQLPPSATDPANSIFTCIIRANSDAELTGLEAKLKELPEAEQIKTVRISIKPDQLVFSVIYPLDQQVEVDALLHEGELFEVTLPERFSPRQPDEALHEINEAVIANKSALTEIDTHMKNLATRWILSLKAIRIALLNKKETIEAMTLAGITEDTFQLIGWCMQENVDRLEQEVLKKFKGLVSVLKVEIPQSQATKIPVATDTSEFLQPYKEIVDVRSIPNYNDIDPTGLMAFFLPLFFGFMVSDIGYGILIFIFSLLVRKIKISGLIGNLIQTFKIGALWSIVFGFAFGELFGNLGKLMGMKPILFSREDPTKTILLMEIAVGIGIFQVMLGLLIGLWNAVRHHEIKHILENLGSFLSLVGIIMLGGGITGLFPAQFTTIGGSLTATGLVAMASSMGLKGIFLAPIEFVGVLGSILSYLRLAALGLASVFLAEVANDLAGKLGGIIIGGLVAVVVHAINLVLGMFSPTIQSMRLQFVEFFRRFYMGGGRQFKPFKVHEPD